MPSKEPDLLDLELGIPTTPADVEALRKHRAGLLTFEQYLRFLSQRPALSSDLFRIARTLVRLADEKSKPSGERLREFRDSELESLYLQPLAAGL